ncbi:hypothetical protein SELMODRAFT_128938 [Selaginella moellendorffii]|uniref:Uncharacterized protein n=1 Tax=Selaginella moellendorffii TaxID=88036 RepID=D8T081_SELML|nr:hypothetical protein SELMODRAFT_128938 [Selaginella moellendorffii]
MVAKNKSKPLAAGGELEIQSGGLPRRLASVDKKVRDRAVELLASWLECRTSVDEADLRKIWKGLFYCYWHADKAIVQADLAERLASLIQRLPSELALQFFEGYLGTMRREWGGIDHLRMDKFYLLQRKFVSSMFMALRQQRWDKEIVQRYMDALKNRAFLSNDLFPAQGCSMHLADIFLEQLDGVLPEEKEVLGILLEPFYATLALGPDKNVLKRVKEGVFDRLLEAARESVKSENKLAEFVTSLPMEKRLFELAASADTLQGNRKVLYALSEDFKKIKRSLDLKALATAAAATSKMEKPASIAAPTSAKISKMEKSASSAAPASAEVKSPEATVKQDDPVVSNLEKKFEVAVEENGDGGASVPPLEMVLSPLIGEKPKKKKKNAETKAIINRKAPVSPLHTASKKRKSSKDDDSPAVAESNTDAGETSTGKKAKKVRFSLKSNTTWKFGKPFRMTPLALDSTPKASALKQGLLPGPISHVSPRMFSPRKFSPKRKNTPSPSPKQRRGGKATPGPKRSSPKKKALRW